MNEFCQLHGIPEGFNDFSHIGNDEVVFVYGAEVMVKVMRWDDYLEFCSLWNEKATELF